MEGLRSIRSNQVHILANLCPGHIFPDIPVSDFADRTKRPGMPQVQNLLKDNRFVYDRDPNTVAERLKGHMRNECILKVSSLSIL
jgi:hypothetical protein